MEAKDIVESLKNFFFDIIGFLLPGIFLLLILSVSILPIHFYSSPIAKLENMSILIFLVVSYILGYLVYGWGVFKDRTLGKISSTKRIERKISSMTDFILAKNKYQDYVTTNNLGGQLPVNITVREIRTAAMSFISESDNSKIYTFMFRSDLCKHIGNVSLTVGTLGIVNYLVNKNLGVLKCFNVDTHHVIFYTILICSYLLFRSARNFFYDIAMKIPFSMFVAKKIA